MHHSCTCTSCHHRAVLSTLISTSPVQWLWSETWACGSTPSCWCARMLSGGADVLLPSAPNMCHSYTARLWCYFKFSFFWCLDYCSTVLASLPTFILTPLQWVLDAAAHTVVDLKLSIHVTSASQELHWLPVMRGSSTSCAYWSASLFWDICWSISQTCWYHLPIYKADLLCTTRYVMTLLCSVHIDKLGTRLSLLSCIVSIEQATDMIWNCCSRQTYFLANWKHNVWADCSVMDAQHYIRGCDTNPLL